MNRNELDGVMRVILEYILRREVVMTELDKTTDVACAMQNFPLDMA